MFQISFQTSITAVVQIFLMGAVGYALVKRSVMDEGGLKLLSHLMVNIFFPLFIFYQLTYHFDFKTVPLWWVFPLISFGITATALAVGTLLLALRPVALRNEFRAVICLHNAGYLPLLLAATLPLGDQAGTLYIYILLSLLGFDISLWSLGVWLLRRSENPGMDIKKLINPPLLTMTGTLVLIFLGWQRFIPEDLMKPVKILGDCALPTAMIVTGGNLGLAKLANVRKWDVGMVCAGKLLIMPLLACAGVMIFKPDPLIGLLVVMQMAVPSATTLSVIGRYYNTPNQEFVNQAIFFTHLMSMVTLPVFLTLYGKLVH